MRPKPILSNPSLNFIAHVSNVVSVCYSQPHTSSFLRICKMLSQFLVAKHGTLPFLLSLPNKFGHALRHEARNCQQFRKILPQNPIHFFPPLHPPYFRPFSPDSPPRKRFIKRLSSCPVSF